MQETSFNRWAVAAAVGLAAGIVSLGWWAGRASAQGIPPTGALHYSGTIAEQGVPVTGARDVTVILWNDPNASAAANQLCVTTGVGLTVTNGRFVLPLVDGCTAALQANPVSYAEVQIGGATFGRHAIGAAPYAVMSGAVNGTVQADSVLMNYGTAPAGGAGGGASIYDDGANAKALVVTGTNVGDGTNHEIQLKDDVTIGRNATVNGAETVGGNLAVGGTVGVGLYVASLGGPTSGPLAVTEIYCPVAGDVAVGGGGGCYSPDDQILYESYPTAGGNGWHVRCINHNNSSSFEPPRQMYVTCASHLSLK